MTIQVRDLAWGWIRESGRSELMFRELTKGLCGHDRVINRLSNNPRHDLRLALRQLADEALLVLSPTAHPGRGGRPGLRIEVLPEPPMSPLTYEEGVKMSKGSRTRAGEPLAAAFAMAADVPKVVAVGVNCSAPGDVLAAVRLAAEVCPGLAHPNSGQGWDAVGRSRTGEPAFDADDVRSWVEAGARLVGGCCQVGPADIGRVARSVRAETGPTVDQQLSSDDGPDVPA